MQLMQGLLAAMALLLAPSAFAQSVDHVGDLNEIRLETVSESRGEGSQGSSHSRSTLVERVVAVRDGGVELEFDLPASAAEDRTRNWQFPARVFKPAGGAFQLLNASELEERLRAWLVYAEIPESACGRWIFTWTSIKIECDPQSVLRTLEAFDLRPGDASTRVEPIDSEALRRELAETDIAVAQMVGEPALSMEAALRGRAADRYEGTITTRYEADSDGWVTQRIVVSEVALTDAHGATEQRTNTTTIQRRRVESAR
ncbi:MAG: hypothetical protein NT015_04040 [Alphaproteobacteria bacterium]|nr:hypothetical protein [Alphaproteobacteria bacterium]